MEWYQNLGQTWECDIPHICDTYDYSKALKDSFYTVMIHWNAWKLLFLSTCHLDSESL